MVAVPFPSACAIGGLRWTDTSDGADAQRRVVETKTAAGEGFEPSDELAPSTVFKTLAEIVFFTNRNLIWGGRCGA